MIMARKKPSEQNLGLVMAKLSLPQAPDLRKIAAVSSGVL